MIGRVGAVYAACDEVEVGETTFDEADVATVLQQGFECWVTVDADSIVGGVVGFASVHREGDVETVVLPTCDPAVRHELLDTVLDRARGLGLTRVSHWAGAGLRLTGPFLEEYGFQPAGTSWKLVRALPAPPPVWPEGITVRPWEDVDARAVHAVVTEAFRGTSYGRERTFEEWTQVHLEHLTDVVCAFRADDLVGVATRGSLMGAPYLAQLAVLPSQRGTGLGTALLLETFARDLADGAAVSSLSVDGDNDDARRIYDGVGMTVATEMRRWDLAL